MTNDYIEEILDDRNGILNKQLERIDALAKIENKNPGELINNVVISYISKKLKPRFKDFDYYLESGMKFSGISMRNMQIGRKARKTGTHKMRNFLLEIVEVFGEETVDKEVLKTATRLMYFSLKNIFEDNKKKEKDKEKLNLFIQNKDFLYVMLQMAVKLIGKDLLERKVDFSNKTLRFMTEMMEKDKKNISQMFEKAVSSQNEKEINSAVSEYYELLSKYFDDFLHREFSGTGKEAIEIGGEQKVVEQFGEENIILFIGVLLGKIQKDVTAATGALDFSSENDVITLR